MKHKLYSKYNFKNGAKLPKDKREEIRTVAIEFLEKHKKSMFYTTGYGNCLVMAMRSENEEIMIYECEKYKSFTYIKI